VGPHGDFGFRYASITSTSNLIRLDIRNEQLRRQNENQDGELYEWLGPSNWLVEDDIFSLLDEKDKETLKWTAQTPELQAWRESKTQ
jgi:hypothetical protein